MTVAEAAKQLEVSPFTVYRLCEQGLLAHHRVGTRRGTIRIESADVIAYKQSRRVEAHPQIALPVEFRRPARIGKIVPLPEAPDLIGEYRARVDARAASRRLSKRKAGPPR